MQSLLLIDILLLSQCWPQPGNGVVMFWYKGWCSSLLLPCPRIYCFWACASYGTAAHYRATPGDLGVLIPEALADVPDPTRMGDADNIPHVLARGRCVCVHFMRGHGGVLVTWGDTCRRHCTQCVLRLVWGHLTEALNSAVCLD